MTKDKENEASLSDDQTFSGKLDDVAPQSLGDQATFAGGFQQRDTQSLGDQATFGGQSGEVDDAFDSDMEIVDLDARYKVEGVLGKGGMGEVLLAVDTRLNRKVAIKRILGSAARSKTAVNRFLTEAQSIAALNHPNIVQIYDYGRAKDGPFLIMEFVEGNSLLDRCRDGALPLEEAVEITCQLCDGLGKAHTAGIIHRDIKPANVLMTTDGVPKLTDFGLAKAEAADTGMTMVGAVLGTLDFMPPEQRRDAAMTDARSDLWSLAATLYQMVTGEPPRVIDLDAVPKELRAMLAQALKTKKEDRYQTALEMRDALKASLQKTAPISIQQSDLGAGECPKCHIPNDATRKFCRECAASLRMSCLKCESEIPVWDKVCGECGAKQQDLLAALQQDLQRKTERAEELRGLYSYEAALEIARELTAIKDDRLSQFKVWADDFRESTTEAWERQKELAREHFTESKKHREAFDYASAIHAIESIPEPMRLPEAQAYLKKLRSEHKKWLKDSCLLTLNTPDPTPVTASKPTQGTGIRLMSFGNNKLNVVKVVKNQTESYRQMSLLEAKNLVESAPVILHERLPASMLSRAAAELEEAGATIEIMAAESGRENLTFATIPTAVEVRIATRIDDRFKSEITAALSQLPGFRTIEEVEHDYRFKSVPLKDACELLRRVDELTALGSFFSVSLDRPSTSDSDRNWAFFVIPSGQATPAPPVGTSLGPYGVNLGCFVQAFNDRTRQHKLERPLVAVAIYPQSFEYEMFIEGIDFQTLDDANQQTQSRTEP